MQRPEAFLWRGRGWKVQLVFVPLPVQAKASEPNCISRFMQWNIGRGGQIWKVPINQAGPQSLLTIFGKQKMSHVVNNVIAQEPGFSLDRWSEGMLPVIPEEKWRKNGQWIGLIREHAELIAQDFLVASKFEEYCKLEGATLPLLIHFR